MSCPTKDALQIVEGGSARTPSETDLKVVKYDQVASLLTVDVSDFAYDGKTWTIQVSRRGVLSLNNSPAATISITVTFKDICWDSELSAPAFISKSVNFELY